MTMSRPIRILIILAGIAVFVVASIGLGRVLSARGAERASLEQLINDEGAGRLKAVAGSITDCEPGTACYERLSKVLAKVGKPGAKVEILQITQGTKVSPGGSTGVARIAWSVGGRLPVAQCVVVERKGSVTSGFTVSINAVSAPIDRTGACPTVERLLAGDSRN